MESMRQLRFKLPMDIVLPVLRLDPNQFLYNPIWQNPHTLK